MEEKIRSPAIRGIRMRLQRALIITALCFVPAQATAQDVPPREILDKIIPQLPKPLPPAKISFHSTGAGTDDACRMQNFDMTLQRENGGAPNKYSVLLNPQPQGGAVTPRQLLAVITRLAVDADGSERAYHPEDPYGQGVCEQRMDAGGKVALRGVCALDTFGPSGIRVFLEDKRARLVDRNKPPKDAAPSLADTWKDVWPLIRDRKLKSYDLKSVAPNAPAGYNLFYWKEKKLTALTKRAIIPSTRDGYPCVRGPESRNPGYFIAATTLTRSGPVRPDGCEPLSYLDAAEIPFFVLPGGNFGHIEIGDIVIGHFKTPTEEHIAFGVAGDAGPIEQFGEGSIAFHLALRGKMSAPVMNVQDVNALDIDGEFLKKKNATLAILVLGGTKKRLGGNYARENIEKIGREELTRWNGGGERLTERLNACVTKAKPAQ
jgi:hypothetical protein